MESLNSIPDSNRITLYGSTGIRQAKTLINLDKIDKINVLNLNIASLRLYN